MRLELGLLKRTASVLAFGTALFLGAGSMAYVEAHDDYRWQRGNHQQWERQAQNRHQKSEKQALKEHQREERRLYGNSWALREHQQRERGELKYHQRNEKNRLNQHQRFERGDYYFRPYRLDPWGDRYRFWR